MPAIVLYRRRWSVGSDDVPLVAGPAALGHVLACGFFATGLWLLRHCHEGDVATSLVRALLACFAAAALLEIAMLAEGLKGECLLRWIPGVSDGRRQQPVSPRPALGCQARRWSPPSASPCPCC
jgi:hypothetical protein